MHLAINKEFPLPHHNLFLISKKFIYGYCHYERDKAAMQI